MKHLCLLLTATAHLAQFAVAAPPPPPEGKRWVLVPELSDEFNGEELDKTKWHDKHPTWVGRPPAIFLPSQVSVGDGYLKITSKKLDKDMVVKSKTYNIAGGAVVSKSEDAWFGYYECRFKAAKTTMSTTFWLSTHRRAPLPAADGESYGLELDIQECVGREGDFSGKTMAKGMHPNSHFWHRDSSGETHDLRSKPLRFESDALCSDGFNTYGAWWRDENSASFYFNNGAPKNMKFRTDVKKKPFDLRMSLKMVSETYSSSWIGLPNDAELDDPARNTCYYDWVRVYRLVDAEEPAAKAKQAHSPALNLERQDRAETKAY